MFTKEYWFSAEDAAEDGTFTGYASVALGEPDSYGDIVMPGAFAKTLARHKSRETLPMMFFGHKADELPIGKWLELAEDDRGLKAVGQLALDDPFAQRVYAAMKGGRVRGLSIGYRIPAGGIEYNAEGKGVNHLKEVDLFEVSVVNIPACAEAQVDGVKAVSLHHSKMKLAAGERLSEREWDPLFKEMGLTNSQAERAVRINLKGQGEPAEAASAADFASAFAALMG